MSLPLPAATVAPPATITVPNTWVIPPLAVTDNEPGSLTISAPLAVTVPGAVDTLPSNSAPDAVKAALSLAVSETAPPKLLPDWVKAIELGMLAPVMDIEPLEPDTDSVSDDNPITSVATAVVVPATDRDVPAAWVNEPPDEIVRLPDVAMAMVDGVSVTTVAGLPAVNATLPDAGRSPI